MAASKLSLYDLLAPQFFRLPEFVDRYLSVLTVEEIRSSISESAVVYSGQVAFASSGGAVPDLTHRDPSGAVFDFDDVVLDFRLTLPRDGAQFIETAVSSAAVVNDELDRLFDRFGEVEQTATTSTEYPGIRFRLELLANLLTFHMGDSWKPGKINDDSRVVPDSSRGTDVRFVLPKVVLEYEQGDSLDNFADFRIKSWGNSGFDAPADLEAGELIRMEPDLALHESGRVAFGIGPALIDLSQDHTPPEILAHFGTDEAFEGLFIKSARFYYADGDKDFALNFGVKDVLISFSGEVSMEASVDILGPQTELSATVLLFDRNKKVEHDNVRATIPNTGVIQVEVQAGVPPYLIEVNLLNAADDSVQAILWDSDEREARISPGMFNDPPILDHAGTWILQVSVQDSTPDTPQTFTRRIELTVFDAAATGVEPDGSTADRPEEKGALPAAVFTPNSDDLDALPAGYAVSRGKSGPGDFESIFVRGGSETPMVSIGGQAVAVDENRRATFQVPEGTDSSPLQILVQYPASAQQTEDFRLLFQFDKPDWPSNIEPSSSPEFQSYLNNSPTDSDFRASVAPGVPGTGADALRNWIQQRPGNSPLLELDAHASWERDEKDRDHNLRLSKRRLAVAVGIIGDLATVNTATATGDTDAADADRVNQPSDRVVRVTGVTNEAADARSVRAMISRAARTEPEPPEKSPTPAPPTNQKPPAFRRLSIRVRLERNVPVLLELSCELDFETELERALRTPAENPSGNLELKQRPGASEANPKDGVVDGKITVTFDTATRFLTERLFLGAGQGDRDGLLQMKNRETGDGDAEIRFKDIFGALLVFTPVINNAASELDPSSAGDWVLLGGSLAVPATIGGLGVFQTQTATLYGGEIQLRQSLPQGEPPDLLVEAGVIFDYGVEFGIHIDALGISTEETLSVRYKAVGFNLHFTDGVHYQPIFDTSKGYEINLQNLGRFKLPKPFGDLLEVLAVRIARVNPLTLEVDLTLAIDLGVVTVDRFKIKWPLDPLQAPTILPTGAQVDIPGVLVGEGYVNLHDDGFEGTIDLTLVSLKLRIAGSVAVRNLEEGNRKALAIFLGLLAELPTPIPVGQSGMGIFGFNGLFAMNYKRSETPRAPGDSVSPALRWLERAGGEPSSLVNSTGQALWGPELDRWSFGVGMILGTVDGGFLVNFRGMFILELPGPRILIFTKVQVIAALPKLGDAKLSVGILGVIDLDFNLGQITVGIIVDLTIESLISVKLPVEVFYKLQQPSNWHLYVGTISQPASALILNIQRGRGYFMIDGQEISPFPPGSSRTLPGIAVATGLEASLFLGSRSAGLYLDVAASAHLGIAFSPLFIIGQIKLSGELRLFIVSIGAEGVLNVEAPDPTFIDGDICGKVSFFFFSVKGCVGFSVGSQTRHLPPPPLLRNVYLQSYAPVITAGQGGDRPIDASLGEAVMLQRGGNTVGTPAAPPNQLPVGVTNDDLLKVPIDSVPVLQLHGSPRTTNPVTTTFTEDLVPSPQLTLSGWINVGGDRRVRYRLIDLRITPPLPLGVPKPPTAWRVEQAPGPQGAKTNIDLGLFTREPSSSSRALERSTELMGQVTTRWENLCKEIAPPVCILWTFCQQPLGTSGEGWDLVGIPQPDPPGTIRNSPPPIDLFVEEPIIDAAQSIWESALADAALRFEIPARVIGVNLDNPNEQKEFECFRALQLPDASASDPQSPNPLDLPDGVGEFLKNKPRNVWIKFHTGKVKRARVFYSARTEIARTILVGQFDIDGTLISEVPVSDSTINALPVIGLTDGLPVEWLKQPWHSQVLPVARFFTDPRFDNFTRIVIQFIPDPNCVTIQLREPPQENDPPSVVVGVIETCPQSESDRIEEAESIREGEVESVTGYLDSAADAVPLLQPAETYTLRIKYEAESQQGNDPSKKTEHVQQVQFRTDETHPPRLDPWVLGTTPAHECSYHFYEDPVKIVFNDLSILQLFDAYGKRLRIAMSAADGVPLPTDEIDELETITAELSTPYREFLEALIEAGILPCVGKFQSPVHGSYTTSLPLRPLMAYTMDIEAIPQPVAPADQATTPLFRRSFSTSKFPNLATFVNDVASRRIRHRVLRGRIEGLPPGAPSVIATDEHIQQALTGAGEQALPSAATPGITIFWALRPGTTQYSPHALLIDAVEPLWRTRVEPQLETVSGQEDTAFQRAVLQVTAALELVEIGGEGKIDRFVRSPGGTRTLALIDDAFVPSPGQSVTIAARRVASSLYEIDGQIEVLIDLVLSNTAPWEVNDE